MQNESKIIELLRSIIKNHKIGLCPFSLPTGSGKSYSVKKLLYEALMDRKDDRKYICITSAKKNKLYDDLEKMCTDKESKNLFKEYVIDIKANSDMIIDNIEKIDENSIEDNNLKDALKNLKLEIQKNDALNKYMSDQEVDGVKLDNKNGLDFAERVFRKTAHKYLKEAYKKQKPSTILEKLKFQDNKDHWMIEAFPGMMVKNKKIIFMTVAKFVYAFDSIIEAPFYFYEDNSFSESVFYVDEFDQAKESMLDQIINRDIKNGNGSINLLGLFDNILQCANRGVDSFPKSFFVLSEKEKNKGYSNDYLRNYFEGISDIAKTISEEYNLFYELKTKDINDENNDFIFHDNTVTRPIGNEYRDSYVVVNEDEKTNYIERTETHAIKLETLLKRIEGFVRHYIKMCFIIAINIRDNQLARGNSFYELSDAISSVVSTMRINDPYGGFIKNQILYGTFAQKKDSFEALNDTFYENGFSLFSIEDSNSHSMNSIVNMEVHEDTPEMILLRMSNLGLTIGLSATADIETSIGNFDLDYLKQSLGENYIELSDEQLEPVKEEYHLSTKKQEGIYIVSFAEEYTEDNEVDCYRKIFEGYGKDEKYCNEYLDFIKNSVNDFAYRKHIYNFIWAFNQFLLNKEINSYLCLLNTYLNGDKKEKLNFLKALLKYIISCNKEINGNINGDKTCDDMLFILDSTDFDAKKEELLDRLQKGEKIFVLSTFQALSTGQNLQYKAPDVVKESDQLIWTNNRDNVDWEKDFDGIFIEKPSNVLVNLNSKKKLKQSQKIETMYQAEELRCAGEISKKTMIQILNRVMGSPKRENDYLYQKDHVKNAEAIKIIQSIGRIDRSNIKNKHVYIHADYSTMSSFTTALLNSNRLISPATNAFFEAVRLNRKGESKDYTEQKMANLASYKSDELGRGIYKIMNEDSEWTTDKIEVWEKMNEDLLKDPQGLTINKHSPFYINLPTESNVYYYKQYGDFTTNEISFDQFLNKEYLEVSEKGTRLDIIMSIPEIKKFFEEKGYSTYFPLSKRMVAPVIANNLLKGRYGEVVGKYLLEKYSGLVLEKFSDPKLYEKFDYHINNYKVVIDFKNWSEKTRFNDDYYEKKMIKKGKDCDAKLIMAINLISKEEYVPHQNIIDDIRIIEIPHLIIKKENKYVVDIDMLFKIGKIIKEYL